MDSNTIGALAYNNTNSVTSGYSATFQPAQSSLDLDMNVQSFIELLAAQLSNQDMLNPMSDADFMAQLAQITALEVNESMAEAMEANTAYMATQYASNLLGQEVTAATVDASGELVKTEGVVTGVSFYEGQPVFYIGDEGFYLSQLMQMGKIPGAEEEVVPETDDSTDITTEETLTP